MSRWRLQWFNDLKIPLLTCLILSDNGDNTLEERLNTLSKLVMDHVLEDLPDRNPAQTHEEAFMASGLKNKFIHAKAKHYIFDILG